MRTLRRSRVSSAMRPLLGMAMRRLVLGTRSRGTANPEAPGPSPPRIRKAASPNPFNGTRQGIDT